MSEFDREAEEIVMMMESFERGYARGEEDNRLLMEAAIHSDIYPPPIQVFGSLGVDHCIWRGESPPEWGGPLLAS